MNISQSIFSHVDEYSACFQFGVISNYAVRNILLYVFLWDVYVRMELLGHGVCICSALVGSVQEFSRAL